MEDQKGRQARAAALSDVATNHQARHLYFIEETYEAGLALLGTEVKSLREGKVNLKESFARIEGGEVFLYRCHISPYSHANLANPDPIRTRKLLMRVAEVNRLFGKTQLKGLTLVPLRIYFKGSWAKLELALARGKKLYDKRATAATKSARRDIERATRGRG